MLKNTLVELEVDPASKTTVVFMPSADRTMFCCRLGPISVKIKLTYYDAHDRFSIHWSKTNNDGYVYCTSSDRHHNINS